MRKIKFRHWDGKKMRIYEPVQFEEDHLWSWDDVNNSDTGWLMQYTGLKDKNGKEIYEGDVIRVFDTNIGCEVCSEDLLHDDDTYCDNHVCDQEVKFNCGWFCEEEIGDFCPPLNYEYLELEIIGNIYENPELIK